MATLEEIRRWAKGEAVKGIESRSVVPARIDPKDKIPKPAIDPNVRQRNRYRVSEDGTDVLLQFGKFRNERLSTLVQTSRGRKYIRWILDGDFDETLKGVCRYQMELWHAR